MAWTVTSSFSTVSPYIAPDTSFLISSTVDSNTRFILELFNTSETKASVASLHDTTSNSFSFTNTTVLHKFLQDSLSSSITFAGDGHHTILAFAVSYLALTGDTVPLPLLPVLEALLTSSSTIGNYKVRPTNQLILNNSILAARSSYSEALSNLLFTDKSYKLTYDVISSLLTVLDTPDPRGIDAIISDIALTSTTSLSRTSYIARVMYFISAALTSIYTSSSVSSNIALSSASANTFNGLCNTTFDTNTSTIQKVTAVLNNSLILNSLTLTALTTILTGGNFRPINTLSVKSIRLAENGDTIVLYSNSANTDNRVISEDMINGSAFTSQAVSNYTEALALHDLRNLNIYTTFNNNIHLVSGSKVIVIPSSVMEVINFTVTSVNSFVDYLYEVLTSTSLADTNRADTIYEIIHLNKIVAISSGYSVIEQLNISKLVSAITFISDNISNIVDLSDTQTSIGVINQLLSSIVKLRDSLANTGYSVISEIVNLSIAEEALIRRLSEVIEQLLASEYALNSISITDVIVSSLSLASTTSLASLFKSLLSDSLLIKVPTGTIGEYSTYSLSPETKGLTTYTNYNFDGSCETSKGDYLFYNSQGIYKYGGKYDDGENIKMRLLTAASSFGTSSLKNIPSIYLGYSAEAGIILKVRVDDKGTYVYKLNKNTNNLQVNKVAVGKGLLGKYFQFELISEEGYLSLDKIKFSPLIVNRKL